MPSSRRYRFPWREGNRFEILVDSPAFLPRMLDAIGTARQYILLEMYLFESGMITDRFIDALLVAAGRGVRIHLLLDDYGTIALNRHDRARLTYRDIEIVYYNPLPSYSTIYNLYRILWRHINRGLYRNHRKLLLVDGRVAYTGSAGITDEVDSPLKPAMRWRETMLEIRGPVLGDWQQLFAESWNKYAPVPLTLPEVKSETFAEGTRGRIAVNEARRRIGMQRSLIRHIHGAKHRIWFATAYFIPPWSIRRKLKRAARSGADVRLLLPGPITDHPGARYSSYRFYPRLMKNGVRIFEYKPRFMHAKTVLCDDWVSIGSCNYDRWNLQWNLEANQEIDDPDMASVTANMLLRDFVDSHEYTPEEWHHRSWRLRVLEWFWRKVELLSMKIRHRHRP